MFVTDLKGGGVLNSFLMKMNIKFGGWDGK